MKLNWKRTFIILTDVVLGIYIVLAFTAFNKPDETAKKCTRVNISIADESNNGFITVAEIKKRLVAGGIYPKGQPLRYVDARKIEERLKMSPFVKTAECYKTQDGQVFINIMDNAIKYSAPGGRITVKIWQGEYKAFIEIIDQGRGIPPEDLENVKTKFYKGSNSVRGSGIGLALVDSIMTALDGTLDIKSTLGRGTVVTLGLPLYHKA